MSWYETWKLRRYENKSTLGDIVLVYTGKSDSSEGPYVVTYEDNAEMLADYLHMLLGWTIIPDRPGRIPTLYLTESEYETVFDKFDNVYVI